MHRNLLLRTLKQADQLALIEHNRRMDLGCLVCHSAVPGRVCPDCYVCVACEPGCDECFDLRHQHRHG